MKMMMQRLVVVVAVVSVMVACSSIAQAKPDMGPDCSGCHNQQAGGALDAMPSSLIQIPQGTTGQITFDVTDLPVPEAAIAISGLDDADLMATVGSGWALSAQNQYASDPFFSSIGLQVLDLTIDANAVVGEYTLGIQMAGGKGFQPTGWAAASQDYTIQVTAAVPEPATLALLLTGFGTVGLLALRRRRKAA
jgi:hypothetical protein